MENLTKTFPELTIISNWINLIQDCQRFKANVVTDYDKKFRVS